MTDLQLGLLLLGLAAVVGVVVYNRWQERAARRRAEQAFGSRHSDVLLGEEAAPASLATRASSGPSTAYASHSPAPPAAADEVLPNPRVDYIVLLRVPTGLPSGAALEAWRPIEQRFGRRVLLAGSGGSGWKRVQPGGFDTFNALQAALQLVSRSGVVADTELIEFRTEAETLAARLRAEVSAPEMRGALDAARELDALCADTDIQVALHVVKTPFEEALHRQAIEAAEAGGHQVSARNDGVTLLLDMPRTPHALQAYAGMKRAALQLASRNGAQILDDRGQALDERALEAIAAQLEPLRRRLSDAGIEPGGALALRLFS